MAWMWGVSGMMLAPPVGWTRRGHVWFDWDFLDDFQLLVGGGFDLIGLLMWLKPPFCCIMCTNSLKLGGGNSNIFWRNDPIWLPHIFQLGRFNHQPASHGFPFSQLQGQFFFVCFPKNFLAKLYIKSTELGVTTVCWSRKFGIPLSIQPFCWGFRNFQAGEPLWSRYVYQGGGSAAVAAGLAACFPVGIWEDQALNSQKTFFWYLKWRHPHLY